MIWSLSLIIFVLQPENSPISAANFAPDDKILKEIDAVVLINICQY